MMPKSGFWELTVYTRNGDSGPGERSRTFTTLRSPDFESGASASSATPGIAFDYIMGGVVSHGRRGQNRSDPGGDSLRPVRSEEHTSELQSLRHLVCRLLLEKKKKVTRSYR